MSALLLTSQNPPVKAINDAEIGVTQPIGGYDQAVPLREVAVLFARRDSIYKQLSGVTVYDRDRDARTWPGGQPIVAHPPCRAWASFVALARPEPGEELNAVWAVRMVRTYGGVLEHPARSRLWKCCDMALPGHVDEWGGWTHVIRQHDFGHKADKATWLYICGATPERIPPTPLTLEYATHVITTSHKCRTRPAVTKAEREATPRALADWLVSTARLCDVPQREVW